MSPSTQPTLSRNFSVNGKYTVLLPIKKNDHTETYRVKGTGGKLFFLKLFTSRASNGAYLGQEEIGILQKLRHPGIVAFIDDGELIMAGSKCKYLVLEFIVGETLDQWVRRENILPLYDIRLFITGLLDGLEYLHSLPDPVIHRELTLHNAMLDLDGDAPRAKIIDFGHARRISESDKEIDIEGMDAQYMAPECWSQQFSALSDLFSVGALLYHLVFGTPPWYVDVSDFSGDRAGALRSIAAERKMPLLFPPVYERVPGMDDAIVRVIGKALQIDPAKRFQSAGDFIKALNNEIAVEDYVPPANSRIAAPSPQPLAVGGQASPSVKPRGFAAIAGMNDLKEQLKSEIINALKNPSEYAEYGVTMPNGLLLYGPPGCGKTFFSKHFAEEVGFNFLDLKPSDVQSKYINETQEIISRLFRDAAQKRPSVIFIDELDAIVPKREGELHQMLASAVNELLTQMDNCSERGIFVVGATNRPEKIDSAILRAGRLDKKVYLPPPDFEARRSIFELLLQKRDKVLDTGIIYDRLATLTDNYVSADLTLIVNNASRKALSSKVKISMEIMEDVIKATKPSVSRAELQRYEALKAKIDAEDQ